MKLNCDDELKETIRSRLQAGPRDRICLCAKRKANNNPYSAVSKKNILILLTKGSVVFG